MTLVEISRRSLTVRSAPAGADPIVPASPTSAVTSAATPAEKPTATAAATAAAIFVIPSREHCGLVFWIDWAPMLLLGFIAFVAGPLSLFEALAH